MKNDILLFLKDKIRKINAKEKFIYIVGPIDLPVSLEKETILFKWYCWLESDASFGSHDEIINELSHKNLASMQQSSVLVYGDFEDSEEGLIRMHSICHTGDIFGSKRCDCGFQLKQSMRMIVENGSGALFYLANHEGRGIGLFSKAMAYVLQENGYDTVEANEHLGFEDDIRNYASAIEVLKSLRIKPVTLITNNPKKVDALKHSGMTIKNRVSLWGDKSAFNEKYLETKINRSGHLSD